MKYHVLCEILDIRSNRPSRVNRPARHFVSPHEDTTRACSDIADGETRFIAAWNRAGLQHSQRRQNVPLDVCIPRLPCFSRNDLTKQGKTQVRVLPLGIWLIGLR